MSRNNWSDLPYLDVLRPDPGWHTEFALFATYSLDLYALVATLLALAGVDDDRGSGSKIDFANAMGVLKGRVCVLAQKGRLSSPSKAPKIMAILDQYVKEVSFDERYASWHPKVAIVKHMSDDGLLVNWHLWVGSRNLSRDMSWDAGLALNSADAGTGRIIPGIANLARSLTERAVLKGVRGREVYQELETTPWDMPTGCLVESIELLEGEGRSLPDEPEAIRELIVISPFIDGTVLNTFGRWGGEATQRLVVSIPSTFSALSKQKKQPLGHFDDLLYINSPLLDGDSLNHDDPFDPGMPEEEEPRGLHAKLICTRHRLGNTLWLGSANVTRRGWLGPNTEVVARLSVSKEVMDSLETFSRHQCREVTKQLLESYGELEQPDLLEDARKVVAANWAVIQRLTSDAHCLDATTDPSPPDMTIQLSVRLLGQKTWIEWPRGVLRILFPHVGYGEQTELLECRLFTDEAEMKWLQLTPMDPPLVEERDEQAIARYLDPRTFLLWVRSLLTGTVLTDGGGDWHESAAKSRERSEPKGPNWDTPTVEEVLKSWSRDPEKFEEINKKVKHYFRWIEQQTEVEQDKEYGDLLTEFRKFWVLVERELVGETL